MSTEVDVEGRSIGGGGNLTQGGLTWALEGDEQSVLHVLDVATGEEVEPPIDRCRYSDVAWLPGGAEFLYVRMVAPDEAPPGTVTAVTAFVHPASE